MAFRFCDSFDLFGTSQGYGRYTVFDGDIVPGRHGNGLQPGITQLALDMQDTWICGFAHNTQTLGTGNIYYVIDGDAGVPQFSLSCLGDGRLRVTRGFLSGALTLCTSTNSVIVTNTWQYIEIKVVIHASAGSVQVRLNGGTLDGMNVTGVNTSASGAAQGNFHSWQGAGGGFTSTFDDLYINDGTGAANNGFFGDVEIMAILPDEDNASFHQWAPLGGSPGGLPQYTQVDDITPDDDGSYIFSPTPGDISLFGFPTLSFTGTVQGVQISAWAKKSDVGNRSFKPVIRRVGTNTLGPEHFLSTDYVYYRSVYDTDPNGSVPWTVAAVNEANFGVKMES